MSVVNLHDFRQKKATSGSHPMRITFYSPKFTCRLIPAIASLFLLLCLPSLPLVSAEDLAPSAVVLRWTTLYGIDTVQAAALTTSRFREGQPIQAWATQQQRMLQAIRYRHLGGHKEYTATLQNLDTDEGMFLLLVRAGILSRQEWPHLLRSYCGGRTV